MVRRLNGRLPWLVACAAVLTLALGSPALAQSTGMVRGVVKDAAGKPVEGAKVSIDAEASNRHFDTKSDKKGEFLQIGLAPGAYKVSAEKDKVASPAVPVTVRIAAGSPLTLVLGGGAPGVDPAMVAKSAALKKTFEEGVTASRAGNHDAAITAFQAAAELNPNCYDCYYNIAFSESQKKDYDKAEAAYKKAIELKADYAEAYSGLANVYNAQRKFDLAATASGKAMELTGSGAGGSAAGGGNADAMFNQGVILWNAGKIAEAKKQFEGAVAANPSHAESHYQLGMALVNEGNLAGAATEFETYLKLAPDGPNAPTAKGILGTLKK
jgi:tetratricopeptide (TPR) repeat protein